MLNIKLSYLSRLKRAALLAAAALISACAAQNNVSFSTVNGSCADGSSNAPYCMAVTITNNGGGQNWITNTNYPISDLALTLSGPSNVGYPTSSGSNYDPNNCLGSSISPGSACTFYLWLSGESAAVGTKPAVVINANYTVNNTLFGGSSTTNNSSLTVYETPTVLLSNNTGQIVPFNANGYSAVFHAESGEVYANAVNNDNYYGYLYMAGSNGIYLSGNGTYVATATQASTTIKGASNLLINGQTLYGVPTNSLSSSVYFAGIQNESFGWQQYASGLNDVANNINAINGSNLFLTQSAAPNALACYQNSGTTVCGSEGIAIPGATAITALGFSNLGTYSGVPLTGLVAGANNGLWVESGIIGLSINQWVNVQVAGSNIITPIVKIASDANMNLYIADNLNHFYQLPVNGSNSANQLTSWSLPGGSVIGGMVYDNAGSQLLVATTNGLLYACVSGNICNPLGSANLSTIIGLNIVTSLTSD